MSNLRERLAENVAEVRGRMAAAAARAGRRAEDVRLVAVTKYVGPEEIRALFAAGCTDLGESRPQQLWDRAAELRDLPIRWHFIGHMQRNKVERTLPLVAVIHSVDSFRLAEAIDAAAAKLDRTVPVLLEVNISREPAKHGFAPEEIEPLLPRLFGLAHIEIRGLMCMAGLEGGGEEARREFAGLRTLRDRLQAACPTAVRLDELSMGMSGDYEIAIEEGATIIRVGSALFEEDNCPDCGAEPGQLHEPFCLKERCPFCGQQLPTCDCIFDVLNLNDEERVAVEEYVDDSVEPLESICRRWFAALENKGRIPW